MWCLILFVEFDLLIFFSFLKDLFNLFWRCWFSIAALGLSLAMASRGYSLAVVCRLLTAVASLIEGHGVLGAWAPAAVVRGL